MNDDVEDFLAHFGVKGMKWGVRNEREPGLSRKTDNEARKDATEFSRAKMFYGTGAGTRRKLIKASVDAKTAKDPLYAKAFERHLQNQNMSDHAQKARSERSRTDKKQKVRQTTGYVARRLTGEMGTTAAFTAAAFAGAAYLSSPAGKDMMNRIYKTIQ